MNYTPKTNIVYIQGDLTKTKVHRFRRRRLPEYRRKIKVASIEAILQATYCGGG